MRKPRFRYRFIWSFGLAVLAENLVFALSGSLLLGFLTYCVVYVLPRFLVPWCDPPAATWTIPMWRWYRIRPKRSREMWEKAWVHSSLIHSYRLDNWLASSSEVPVRIEITWVTDGLATNFAMDVRDHEWLKDGALLVVGTRGQWPPRRRRRARAKSRLITAPDVVTV